MRYYNKINDIKNLDKNEKERINSVCSSFKFKLNEYYENLIDWRDPDDPLKKIVIPCQEEMDSLGKLDFSDESVYQPVRGLEHKYKNTAILLCSANCAAICRFCFRKRLFMSVSDEMINLSECINYIEKHQEINNVLLSGGDPLMLKSERLGEILKHLVKVEHINAIRIGTKVPAYNPLKIAEDKVLVDILRHYSSLKQILFITHFNHPKELTDYAVNALLLLKKHGLIVYNQTPILKGINDSDNTLKTLIEKLNRVGVNTYYIFGCRLTSGNRAFALPIEKAFDIVERVKNSISSGLYKSFKFVLSDRTGKIEVCGYTSDCIIFKNHNMANTKENGIIRIYKRNPEALWIDDYKTNI